MHEVRLMLAACILTPLGFALLALSQERHWGRAWGSNKPYATAVLAQRATGFVAIGLSLLCCVIAQGASFGSLLWVMHLSAAAMAVAFMLTWRPHWLRPLARAVQIVFQCSSNSTLKR
ncbi:MAG: DUF3325 domain-containing protein [Polaromonas sp.]